MVGGFKKLPCWLCAWIVEPATLPNWSYLHLVDHHTTRGFFLNPPVQICIFISVSPGFRRCPRANSFSGPAATHRAMKISREHSTGAASAGTDAEAQRQRRTKQTTWIWGIWNQDFFVDGSRKWMPKKYQEKWISVGGIPNSCNVLFLQIFLKRAAKPSAGNTSACSKASQTFSGTFSGALLNLTWPCTKTPRFSGTVSGTFSGTLLNLTWLCTKASHTWPGSARKPPRPSPEPSPKPCGTWPCSAPKPPRPSPEPSPEPCWT